MIKPLALKAFPEFVRTELERRLLIEGISILEQFSLRLNHDQAVTLYEAERTPPEEYYQYLTENKTQHFIVAGFQEDFYDILRQIRGKWQHEDLSSSGIRAQIRAAYQKLDEEVPPYENAIHMTLNQEEFACSIKALGLNISDLERQVIA